MSFQIQEGIYYANKPSIGNSFCILSLMAGESYRITELGIGLGRIWKVLSKLKYGILSDMDIDGKHRKTGNLSVLVAYGPNLFDYAGSEKKRPSSFCDDMNFRNPCPEGGGPVFDGSTLKYSNIVSQNHLLKDHVIFQFIADNEFYTNRAVVEVWKEIQKSRKNLGISPFSITGMYTGFQRADYRNWLGFHDGVSNLKRNERKYVIPINPRFLNPRDRWTQNGTYLAFLRIAIDLERWIETSIEEQEILIGRDKLTGCPLVKVDRNGKPVKDSRCPIRGTSEIIDRGNEQFRNHPNYDNTIERKLLQYSHIADTNPSNRIPVWDKNSFRIYRQGFEFLIHSDEKQKLMTGLNFVSFQNSPERLRRALAYRPPNLYQSSKTTVAAKTLKTLNQFMSVLSAGIFFVPPVNKYGPFPGAEIFVSGKDLDSFKRKLLKY